MSRLTFRRRLARLTAIVLSVGAGVGSATVHAAQAAPDLLALPWLQIGLGVWISAWGGGAATLTRYLACRYDDRPFITHVEIAKDVMVSGVVGGLTYFTGALYDWPALAIGPALLISGWLGVRLLNVAADRLLSSVVKQ